MFPNTMWFFSTTCTMQNCNNNMWMCSECTVHTFYPRKEPSNWFTGCSSHLSFSRSHSEGESVTHSDTDGVGVREYVLICRSHTGLGKTVSVESTVVLLMFTQYLVRGRAFHVTIMVFGADRTAVMTVAIIVQCLTMLMRRKLQAHHEQLELLCLILQTLHAQCHY